MFKHILAISVAVFICFTCGTIAIGNEYKEDELIIKFSPKTSGHQRSKQEKNELLASFNCGEVKHSVKLVPGLSLVKLPENLTVKEALEKLKGKGGILYVEPNYKIKIFSTIPNDTRFSELWAMRNTGANYGTPDADIDANDAWDIRTTSTLTVAVIDTGVDYTHPDLAANMWVNKAELYGTPGFDDDDNGYPDDVYGYDFCTFGGKQRDSDPMDDHYHGTHVAGIIGAIGNNGLGVTGTCWSVKIMALKCADRLGYGWSYDMIAAIDYAVEMGVKVLNCSGGYYYDDPFLTDVNALEDAVEAANSSGALVVAAVGNGDQYGDPINIDREPAYPASYECENIIAVMATNNSDNRSYYSNYGIESVDLAAPGGDSWENPRGILSTFPTTQTDGMDWYGFTNTYYEFIQGTSMAAPHVAGACALVWARHPQLTHLQVKQAILNSVDHLDSLYNLCDTEGRLNLYKALNYFSPIVLTITDYASAGEVEPYESFSYEINYSFPDDLPD